MGQIRVMFNKFDYARMATAQLWAKLSWCKKLQVGAVLTKDNRIVAHGYNGTVEGLTNDCEDKEGNT